MILIAGISKYYELSNDVFKLKYTMCCPFDLQHALAVEALYVRLNTYKSQAVNITIWRKGLCSAGGDAVPSC